MADLLEIEAIPWKPRAYRFAAQNIESLSKDIKKIYEKKGEKGLDDIPGIGEGIATKIIEYLETGKIKEYNKLKRSIPKGVIDMLHVPTLGPKKVNFLYKKLKITNLRKLKKIAEEKKLRYHKGYDKKTEENIRNGIKILKQGRGRMALATMTEVANNLIAELKQEKPKKIAIVGSLRRKKSTIKDIDILVVSNKNIMKHFTSLGKKIVKGPKKASILYHGIQVDLRLFKEDEYGAAMQYFTGSKNHNIKLRQIAIKKGYKLNEYGLFKGKKKIAGKTEREIYKKLSLPLIPPELRENDGEFTNKIPKLVTLKDIKGDFHTHSTYSDGLSTLKDLSLGAKKLNYEYLAVTDHGTPQKYSGPPLTMKRLNEKFKEIKKYNNLIMGVEVDIVRKGKLFYKDSLLKKMDVVIASMHTKNKGDQTKTFLKAMDNKHINIMGHLTGRKFGIKEPRKMNFDEIFDKARDNNIAIEINCTPTRMDIDDKLVKRFVKKGGIISLGTDTHDTDNLETLQYGIGTARRGWCKKKDILNTKSREKLYNFLK